MINRIENGFIELYESESDVSVCTIVINLCAKFENSKKFFEFSGQKFIEACKYKSADSLWTLIYKRQCILGIGFKASPF